MWKRRDPMTPDQVKAVQASFAKVVPIADTAAGIFYSRLFEIAPEVKPLFRNDMTNQIDVSQITVKIKNLDQDKQAVQQVTAVLRERHRLTYQSNDFVI